MKEFAHVFRDSVRMIDAVDTFRHEDGLLLDGHGLRMIAHDVIQPSQHSQTLGDLRVHGAVHVVEQVQRFVDQFVAFFEEALLNFVLSSCVEIVRVASL